MSSLSFETADKAARAAYQLGSFVLFTAVAAIAAALAFQHVGGYQPCELCYLQRWAYYAGIPLTFAALVLLSADYRRTAALIFLLVAVGFLVNSGIGAYQAGAEWKYWPGPTSCSGDQGVVSQAGNLLEALKTTQVVRCDEAQLRILGLSFAGWNAILCFVLFVAGLKAAFAAAPDNRR